MDAGDATRDAGETTRDATWDAWDAAKAVVGIPAACFMHPLHPSTDVLI